MIRTGIKLLAAALLGAAALSAQADTYPSRPIKVVSPFPAGGATDVLTRCWPNAWPRIWASP